MNKLNTPDSTSASVAGEEKALREYHSDAWYMHITRLDADNSILIHILSFVFAEKCTVRRVCKKWRRWGFYATFDRNWRPQKRHWAVWRPLYPYGSASPDIMQNLLHVLQFEPWLALRSPYRHLCLRLCCAHGYAWAVRDLLKSAYDPDYLTRTCFEMAVANGHTAIVDLFLADCRLKPEEIDQECFYVAACYEDIGTVTAILKDGRFDSEMDHDDFLDTAVQCGNVNLVQSLLRDARFTPSHSHMCTAIRCNAKMDVLKMLLSDERVDPTKDNRKTICAATETNNGPAITSVLLADGRFDPTANLYEAVHCALTRRNLLIAVVLMGDPRVDLARAIEVLENAFRKDSYQMKILWEALDAQ